MNVDQTIVYQQVMAAVENSAQSELDANGQLFFVDGPGGTGKTFLYNALLDKVRSSGRIALATASSGIAATLLTGGRTAHSTFKIPLQLSSTSTCSITLQSPQAELLKSTNLILWDEAPMVHRHAFEAVDRLLRDIMATVDRRLGDIPFGGKVVRSYQ